MAVVPLFKHRKKNIKVVGGSNRTYAFINHQYFTSREEEIKELTKLAVTGACGIYIDSNDMEIDTDASTPMDKLRKTMRDELLAELTSQGRLVESSTSDQSTGTAKVTSTADSTINSNSAAEQAEAARKVAEAVQKVANNPALSMLELLKQGAPTKP